MWMKRLSFTMCVQCPCERICEPHKKEGCTEESCVHFLNLDECLANKVCSKFDFFFCIFVCLSAFKPKQYRTSNTSCIYIS